MNCAVNNNISLHVLNFTVTLFLILSSFSHVSYIKLQLRIRLHNIETRKKEKTNYILPRID